MGGWNSGRRPDPTRLRILRGNPSKTPINPNEPQPEVADPSIDEPPDELKDDAIAAREWRRLVPRLRALGLIAHHERGGLIALCQQWSRYLTAHEQVIAQGIVMQTDKGLLVVNPYLKVADAALSHCHKLWAEFGITPSARTRTAKLQPTPDDAKLSKWAGLLR